MIEGAGGLRIIECASGEAVLGSGRVVAVLGAGAALVELSGPSIYGMPQAIHLDAREARELAAVMRHGPHLERYAATTWRLQRSGEALEVEAASGRSAVVLCGLRAIATTADALECAGEWIA